MIATSDGGFVAIAGRGGAERVWVSTNGVDWAVPTATPTLGPDDHVWGISPDGSGFIAWGQRDDDVVLWTSADGVSWERVPESASLLGTEGALSPGPGASTESVKVMVGEAWRDGDLVGAVWTSLDGRQWSRVPHADGTLGFDLFLVSMNDVIAGGPGFVAVGRINSFWGSQDAAVWTSPDGIQWTLVPNRDAVFSSTDEREGYAHHVTMDHIVAAGSTLIAYGSDTGGAAVWTSRDGLEWQRQSDPIGFVNDPTIVAGGPGFVAAGSIGFGRVQTAAIAVSEDGIHWYRVPHSDPLFGEPDSFP